MVWRDVPSESQHASDGSSATESTPSRRRPPDDVGTLAFLLVSLILGGLLSGAVTGLILWVTNEEEAGKSPGRWIARQAVTASLVATGSGMVAYAFARPVDRSEAPEIALMPLGMGCGFAHVTSDLSALALILSILFMGMFCAIFTRIIMNKSHRLRIARARARRHGG